MGLRLSSWSLSQWTDIPRWRVRGDEPRPVKRQRPRISSSQSQGDHPNYTYAQNALGGQKESAKSSSPQASTGIHLAKRHVHAGRTVSNQIGTQSPRQSKMIGQRESKKCPIWMTQPTVRAWLFSESTHVSIPKHLFLLITPYLLHYFMGKAFH